MRTVISKIKYLRIAPRKARAVANLIKGLPIEEAEAQLMLNPRRPSRHILKGLRSGIANAKNNFKIDETSIYVKDVRVDKAPVLKRMMPRAMGRANLIEKKMSHITIVLEEKEASKESRFVIPREKPKEKEKEKKADVKKPTVSKRPEREEQHRSPIEKKEGFLKKVFRRKSV